MATEFKVDIDSELVNRYVRFFAWVRLKKFRSMKLEDINMEEVEAISHEAVEKITEYAKNDPGRFIVYREKRSKK